MTVLLSLKKKQMTLARAHSHDTVPLTGLVFENLVKNSLERNLVKRV